MSVTSEKRRRARERNALATLVDPGPDVHITRYRDAVEWLQRPFMPEAVQFRVWEAWRFDDAGPLTHASVVPYIDVRTVFLRLNAIMPEGWSEDPITTTGGQHFTTLRIFGATGQPDMLHIDLGDREGKGRLSDGLKRAATHVGVGLPLYFVPDTELSGDEYLRPWREWDSVAGKWVDTLKLTRRGEDYCRDIYRRWLLARGGGIDSFGKPIDHGNLTMLGEAEGDGPPMPVAVPAVKAPPKRPGGNRARPVPTVPSDPDYSKVTPDASPDDRLAVLLKVRGEDAGGDDAWILRAACNKAMEDANWPVELRLSEFAKADADRKGPCAGLRKLLTTVGNVAQVPDPEGEPIPSESDGNSTSEP